MDHNQQNKNQFILGIYFSFKHKAERNARTSKETFFSSSHIIPNMQYFSCNLKMLENMTQNGFDNKEIRRLPQIWECVSVRLLLHYLEMTKHLGSSLIERTWQSLIEKA
jgi:hypothetical protein